jgi:hypothetical protein
MRTLNGLEIIRREVQLVAARTMFCAALAGAVFPCAQATTFTVTSTADDGSAGTLRVALASASSGDTIDATGIAGTITPTNGTYVITNSVTILEPGANLLAITGWGGRPRLCDRHRREH